MSGRTRDTELDPSSRFFEDLKQREHEPLLQTAEGTVRFDLVDNGEVEHWYLTLQHGEVDVSHRRSRADSVVRIDRDRFDAMVSGEMNALAAALRGDIVVEGDLGLVLLFQRVFPPPTRPKRSTARPHATKGT